MNFKYECYPTELYYGTQSNTDNNLRKIANLTLSDLAIDFSNNITMKTYRYFTPSCIKDVQFYPPATKMFFTDGTVITSVAQDGDEYNKEDGMIMCILEYIFGDKKYNNMFRKWIKKDEKRQAEKLEKEEKAKEEKEIKKRQAEKEARRKAARAEKAKQREIEIQTEAYLRAMRKAQETSQESE